MLCHLLGRAIVLVRDDQLSLAIGRRGQNVRLASKLVGWDIEIMTAEELDEVIEKAVKAFEKIDVVDTELAERLVEQGILSYDDLSVMEITDLVNTIEGLTEEQAVEIVARAETLAEEQTEELPRRKGARRRPAERAGRRVESRPTRGRGRRPRPAVDRDGEPSTGRRRFGLDADARLRRRHRVADASAAETGSALPTEPAAAAAGEPSPDDGTDSERDEASDDEIHDVALAVEKSSYLDPGPRGDLPAQRRRSGRDHPDRDRGGRAASRTPSAARGRARRRTGRPARRRAPSDPPNRSEDES